MGKNFKKLRDKTRFAAFVLTAAFAIGSGALALGALVLVLKLIGIPVEWWYYLSGALVAVVVATVSLLMLWPSDARLAERFDEEHSFGEKARTMIEFRDSSDAFSVLQREDADERLAKINYTPWRKKQVIVAIVGLVLSAALLITALIIPSRADMTEPEAPLDEFSKDWIITELTSIKSTVERSPISDTLKADVVEELSALISFVESHDFLSQMKIEAIKTIIAIDDALRTENTAVTLGTKLSECRDEILKALGEAMLELNGTGTQKQLGALEDALEGMELDDVSYVVDELSNAISSSGASDASPLVVIFKNLTSALYGYSNGSVDSISAAYGTAKLDALDEVMTQSSNKRVTNGAISRISELFGIKTEDLVNSGASPDIDITKPEVKPSDEDVFPEQDEDDRPIGSGGIGTGDRVYGSDDMIYNPYTNKYVPYGELLDEYNNRVIEMIRDGKIPPSLEDFTKDYFRSLSELAPDAE